MKKASLIIDKYYFNNRIFQLDPDGLLISMVRLKEAFYKHGVDLSTSDINSPYYSDIIVCSDMPFNSHKIDFKKIKTDNAYLLLFETELIRPENWNIDNHKYFYKIFTWNDDFVDNKKYFKINSSNCFDNKINKDLSIKNKFCTLISGNKMNNNKLELYSERVKAIRWFEKYHPDDFDLFGRGWEYGEMPYMLNKYKKNKFVSCLFSKKFPSYRGPVVVKKDILEKYRFAICYENARDITGYITEKIFDCFIAGTIPIYWGANNVKTFIPENCFIDKTKFSSYEDLYDYLESMDDKLYLSYLNNIDDFLNSDKILPFTADYFTNTIVKEILGEV